MSTVVGNLSVELGISDDQLRAGLAAAMAQAQAAGNNISNSLNKSASSSTKGFAAISLSISRMADDAQYGFRGVINNLEQLGTGAALALGASTSAAMMFGGALTLAGIAINALLQKCV
jgi:autotransporter adhesin